MTLDPAQHVQRSESIPADLALTPQDYFVLSRVEGPMAIGDLVRACGLPTSDASAIVEKLIDGGALTPCAARSTPSVRSTPTLRTAAQARKREALAAALAGSRSPGSAVQTPDAAEPAPRRQEEPEPQPRAPARVERRKVAEDDARIDESYPIDVERQRWVLAMADEHEQMSQFEILGLQPTHDIKAIKRAYHETSRVLHPDAYHGRDLGPFRSILSSLFREAKVAYGELRREDVRAPWVDRRIEEDARAQQEEAAEAAEARIARDTAAAARREERTRARAERQREALRARMSREARSRLADAEAAEAGGNLAKAANLYRLAVQADPNNEALAAKWKALRTAAREKRGAEAYARAQHRLDLGQVAEALPWLLEAAEAMPTAEHLAHAAFLVGEGDPNKGRDLAMRALEALRAGEASSKIRPIEGVRLRLWIGRAFLAAGQVSTARAQAESANQLRPDDPEVHALLKACKAK